MEQIWAPWRSVYIGGEHGDGCVFCDIVQSNQDRENLVLQRGEKIFIVMNRYPYTNGHLMLVPQRHVGEFEELTEDELAELFKSTQLMVKALRAFNPEGFNVGINIGKIAGAGVPGHVHIHVVPRWGGDTNFMPVFGDVRVISESLEVSYQKIKDSMDKLE